jgi:hypothetical protein
MDAGEGEDPTTNQRRPETPAWSSSAADCHTQRKEKKTY